MDSTKPSGVKRYLIVRWRKRRHTTILCALIAVAVVSYKVVVHDPKAPSYAIFFASFIAIGLLFPFHWGGESGWDEKEWDE